MKKLNTLELKEVAGGEKFLLITSTIDIEGMPASCIERFFNASSNMTLVGALEDNLSSMLTTSCDEFMNFTGSRNHSHETNKIAFSVIEE